MYVCGCGCARRCRSACGGETRTGLPACCDGRGRLAWPVSTVCTESLPARQRASVPACPTAHILPARPVERAIRASSVFSGADASAARGHIAVASPSRRLDLQARRNVLVGRRVCDSAECCNRNLAAAQRLAAPVHHALAGDAVDNGDDLAGAEPLARGDQLAANVFRDSSGAVKREQEGAAELGLGAVKLGVGEVAALEAVPLVDDGVDEAALVGVLVHNEVHAPETDVGVGGGEGHEGVAEWLALGEKGRGDGVGKRGGGGGVGGAVPVAHNGLRHKGPEVVWGGPGAALDADGHVGVGQGVVGDLDVAGEEDRQGCARGAQGLGPVADGHVAEVLEGDADHVVVVDAAGADEHHAVALVVGLDVVAQVRLLDAADAVDGPENGAAERLAAEHHLVQPVKHHLVVHLVHLLALADDHGALLLDGHLLQLRPGQDVRENVHRPRNVLLQRLCVVHRVLSRRVRVQVRPAVLHLQLEVHLRPVLRALERQVLQEVRRSGRLVRHVCTRPGVDPHPDRRRQRVRNLLRRHRDPVRQDRHHHAALVAGSARAGRCRRKPADASSAYVLRCVS